MNKFVFKKVAELTANTELSEVKVDLALAQDVATRVKNYTATYQKYLKSQGVINKNIDAVNALLTEILPNLNSGKAMMAEAQKYRAQMDKLSKELGVPLTGSDLDKGISELYMIGDDLQGVMNDVQAKIKSIGK
jgi:hypothetical protein